MIQIPFSDDTLVIRTDFTNDKIWDTICKEIIEPHPTFGFTPFVEFVNDKQFENISADKLREILPKEFNRTFIFVVDKETFEHPEHTILCIDLYEIPGQTIRLTPNSMWDVDNNLTISNANFEDYVLSLDTDGIYRSKV
jgi:hypothetical protein